MCFQFWVCFTAVRTEQEREKEREGKRERERDREEKERGGVSVIETRSTCQKNELTITQN